MKVYLVTLGLLILGCGDDATRSGAICLSTPDSLAFGSLSTPPFGWVTDYVVRDLVVSNQGDSELCGMVAIHIEPTGPTAARFHLSPQSTDPDFCVAPGESISFTIGVTMENRSFGDYVGRVELGTVCRDVSITLFAFQSQ